MLWKQFNIRHSYTLETSIYGYMLGNSCIPFTRDNYFSIADSFLSALIEFAITVENMHINNKLIRKFNLKRISKQTSTTKAEATPTHLRTVKS